MRNSKKGFTLVELLAVIAILAILVIIAMPNVLSQLRSARKNSFQTEVQTLYSEAQKAYVSDALTETASTHVYSTMSTCGKKLDISGGTNVSYYISMTSQGKIDKFYATNGSYYYVWEGTDLVDASNIQSANIVAIDGDNITITCGNVSGGNTTAYQNGTASSPVTDKTFVGSATGTTKVSYKAD